MSEVNLPSKDGCRVFSEKTMWRHDPRVSLSGGTRCVKCGMLLPTAPVRAGRIE